MEIKHGKIVTQAEAHDHGYEIEGPIAFLFDLRFSTAILGWNSIERMWQFDTEVNDEGESWQFLHPDIHTALDRADAVADYVANAVAPALCRLSVVADVGKAHDYLMENAFIKHGLIAC